MNRRGRICHFGVVEEIVDEILGRFLLLRTIGREVV